MRKLLWFAVGFAAACFIGLYLLSGLCLVLLGVICLAAAIILFCIRSESYNALAIFLVGLVTGLVWLWCYDAFYLQNASQYDGETIQTTVSVSDYSYDTSYGVAADGTVALEGKTYRIRLYLVDTQPLSPGDEVRGSMRLRMTTGNSIQGATYHQGDGVFLLAFADEGAQVDYAEKVPQKYFAAWLRRQITNILDFVFPEDTLAFSRALLLGDSSLLSYEEDTAFKVSGIRHIIAVSGLHVSILFALVCMFSGRRRVLTAMIGIPVLLLFSAVAGFSPSIMRACVMQMLVIFALLFNQEYDPPTALAFAVLVMLVLNPMTITSVGFQLSVGCVIGIFLFYERINNYILKRLGRPKGMSNKAKTLRWFSGSVSVSLSAMVFATPLCAFYFGTVSLVGVLTNLLTLWVVSFVFYGIMVVCVLGALWTPLARLVAWAVSWPIRYIQCVARVLSGIPFAAVYTCSSYIVAWLVLCYILFGVYLLSKRKQTGIFIGCVFGTLMLTIALTWLEPRLDNYRVTVLDVGQGQSILLQCRNECYLVDCGGDYDGMAADAAAQQLLSQGITHLDGIILTHYDGDHAGGVLPLLTRISAEALYLPDVENGSTIRSALESAYADRIVWISQNYLYNTVNMRFSLFPTEDADTDNEGSMCILFQIENCDILITGDRSISGELELIEATQLPALELLVVGHHGSGTATGFALLEATRPKAAVISVGAGNPYGHPSYEVLGKLKLFGCRIWRTDLDGTIIFRG